MIIKKPSPIKSSEITSETVYQQRRSFMKGVMGSATLLASGHALAALSYPFEKSWPHYQGPSWLESQLSMAQPDAQRGKAEKLTPYPHVVSHNNFYEFGLKKQDPSRLAQKLITDPWSVEVTGEANKTNTFTLEDLISPYHLEERIYRLRCVEGWSMVIPWVGIPLATLLKRFEPRGNAKYVEFTTLLDPKQMPGQKGFFTSLKWPYTEGLRIDEAMHPLAFLAVGVYGKSLPPQNGAPLRLVVPWKYGFKSIKSIVRIRFTENMPLTSWNQSMPREYGFFANVNPSVDHPRWSQATERRLPSSLFTPNIINTEPFNGYADEVASLYSGMDLTRWF